MEHYHVAEADYAMEVLCEAYVSRLQHFGSHLVSLRKPHGGLAPRRYMAWCGVWQDGCGHGWQAVIGGPGWGVTAEPFHRQVGPRNQMVEYSRGITAS